MREFITLVERAQNPYLVDVPTAALGRFWSPFRRTPWASTPPLSKEAVRASMGAGEREDHYTDQEGLEYHAGRVAYLVNHPAPEPIYVWEDGRGGWELEDGNHRLAAAIYRGDKTVKVHVSDPEAFMHWISYEG